MHAVVIGAGFGGIAAALRLRAKGYQVTLLDRCSQLGGRAQVFERDGYRCQHVKRVGSEIYHCWNRVTWETGHLAHIQVKRMGGDTLANTFASCADCHRKYHAYGPSLTKPCPRKEAA